MTTSSSFQSYPKPRTERDAKYIRWVRHLACSVCNSRPPSDPHHIAPDGCGGKGIKTSDKRAIPLCHYHHVEYHNIGKHSFAAKHELDYDVIIEALNASYERCQHDTRKKI